MFSSVNFIDGTASFHGGAAGGIPRDLGSSLGQGFQNSLNEVESSANSAMSLGFDSQSHVEKLAQAQLSVEAAVVLRDKAVEAYQEILRMPV